MTDRNNVFFAPNLSAGEHAVRSSDPDISAAGRELFDAAREAGELDVGSHGKADMAQAEARIAAAQQKLTSACRALLGEPPWS